MRLFLSCVPADFDYSVDVAAGPWCFVDRPEDFEIWSALDFIPEPGEAGLDYRASMDSCAVYAQRLLAQMTPELNRLNGTNHSHKFWSVMGIFWMLSLLQMVFLAQARANALRERYGTRLMEVELITVKEGWHFSDTAEFSGTSFYSTDFFGWLLSRFLEENLPALWTASRRPAYRLHSKVPRGGYIRKWLQRNKWLAKSLIAPRCLGVYGIRNWQAWLFSMLLSLKAPAVCAVLPNKPFRECEQNKLEEWLASLTNESVLTLAWETLPANLRDLRLIPKIRWFRRKGKIRLVGGSAMVAAGEVSLAVAESVEAEEYIIVSQHGAVYGDGRQSMAPYVEYNLGAFVTWGWRTYENFRGHFIPLPSPLLSSNHTHKEREEMLLFVGQIVPLLKPRLDCTPDSVGFIHYVRMKKDFLGYLASHIFNKLWYRDQPASGTLDDVCYLQKYFPTLNILNRYPEDELYSCRLLVMDNPSTTLHKALSANVPTICFWQRDDWQMTSEAETYYDLLRKAGILFHDPISAAEHANRVWPNVQGWWRSDKVQQARKAWCKQYALADEKWFSIWAKTLWNLRELQCPIPV